MIHDDGDDGGDGVVTAPCSVECGHSPTDQDESVGRVTVDVRSAVLLQVHS